MTNLQVYRIIYGKTEGRKIIVHYIRGFYELEPVVSEKYKNQQGQKTPKRKLQTRKELPNEIGKEMRRKSENGCEEYAKYLANFGYELTREKLRRDQEQKTIVENLTMKTLISKCEFKYLAKILNNF